MLPATFARFVAQYPLPLGRPDTPPGTASLWSTPGYGDLARPLTGLPLCGGMLRLLGSDEVRLADAFIQQGFPEFAMRIVPFAVDWLGRVFALDLARPPGVLLVEPGSAGVFEIDESFVDFFNVSLVDDPETFLAADLFQDWQAYGGETPGSGQCVGFKIPLFLGGSGSVVDLELNDLDVYWTLSAQLGLHTRALPPGVEIHRVDGR